MEAQLQNIHIAVEAEAEENNVTVIVLIVFLSVFALMGTIGNGLSTFVFYRIRHKTSAHIFILSLSLIDLFTCIIIIPFTIFVEYVYYEVKYDIVCKLYQFFITSKVPLSAFMMTAIALDRYFCICHSLKRIVTPFRTKVIVGCLVTFASALGIATSLGYGVYYKSAPTSELPDEETLRQFIAMTQGAEVQPDRLLELLKLNLTNISLGNEFAEPVSKVIYTGICRPYLYGFIFDEHYIMTYQRIYSSLFVVCLIVVGVFYSLIYRFIKSRRTKKLKQKLVMCTYTHCEEGKSVTKIILSPNKPLLTNENSDDVTSSNQSHVGKSNIKKHRHNEEADKLREEARSANIKTAAMLFIVTVVYILAFTPAWLMAFQIVPKQKIVFYLYFTYNVANPLIYAFMNQTFKDHLTKIRNCFR